MVQLNSFSQMEEYVDIMEKQTTSDNVFRQSSDLRADNIFRKPYKLNPDFFSIVQDKENVVFGISDPFLDSLEAYKQASNRALALAYVLFDCSASIMSDYFYSENNLELKTLYAEFYELLPSFRQNIELIVLDSVYTSYNECILACRFRAYDRAGFHYDPDISFQVYINEKQNQSEFNVKEKIIMESLLFDNTGQAHKSAYVLWRKNRFFEALSRSDSAYYNIERMNYKYVFNTRAEDGKNYMRLKNGLWEAYFKSLIKSQSLISKNKSVKLSNVSDLHRDVNKNLIRQVSKSRISSRIQNIRFTENDIKVILTEQN